MPTIKIIGIGSRGVSSINTLAGVLCAIPWYQHAIACDQPTASPCCALCAVPHAASGYLSSAQFWAIDSDRKVKPCACLKSFNMIAGVEWEGGRVRVRVDCSR
jgi:hypothetical protein